MRHLSYAAFFCFLTINRSKGKHSFCRGLCTDLRIVHSEDTSNGCHLPEFPELSTNFKISRVEHVFITQDKNIFREVQLSLS